MKTFDLIMSRIMMLPIVLVTPFFSFLAGIIWWVCFVSDVHAIDEDGNTIIPVFYTPLSENKIFICVSFLNRSYELFTLKKVKRDKGGSIKK